MATLSNILRDVLIELGELRINLATGGSATTIVDSGISGSDDDYNGGTMILIRDAAGAAGAPQEEFAEVTDYTASSGTITGAASSFSANPVAGDTYGVGTIKYPHFHMIQMVNRALSQVGDVPRTDTSITTAASQTEYAVPVALKRQPPYRVDLQIVTTDSNNNQWKEIDRGRWYYVPVVGGTTGLLIVPDQLPTGRLLRLWYKRAHSAVSAYNDTIYEGIHEEQLVWETVYRALRHRASMLDKLSDIDTQLLQEANVERQRQKSEHTIWKPQRRSSLLIVKRFGRGRDRFTFPDPA